METFGAVPRNLSKLRILLADDHHNVRVQLHARLIREPDFDIVAEAIDGAHVVECTRWAKPQIVLIDPMMRDGLGLRSVQQVVTSYPQIAIVILIAVADTAMQMELRRIGVQRILNKGIESSQLVGLLRELGSTTQDPSVEHRL